MLTIENQASLEAALLRDINLFVGAGFSVLAKDKFGASLPVGSALVDELCSKFNEETLRGQQLPLVSQIIKSKDKGKFNEFLINRFSVSSFDQRYNNISALAISRIFTTNIDDLFQTIYSTHHEKYLNDLILQGATFRDRTAVEFLPLHGSVSYPDPDFTFTPIEIASAFANNPTQFQYLVTCLLKSATLFLGYSLQDAGALQSLNYSFSSDAQDRGRWMQLRDPRDTATITYFKSLGFNIIIAETDEILDYLTLISNKATVPKPYKLSQADFKSGRIPTLKEAPVRPISDYFRGHAPIWHDVLTKRVPTTSMYSKLINSIDAGRNVLLMGIPVSGKSTLLMQAAAYLDTSKIKLFEDAITPEKAHALVNQIRGNASVILFVDNVGDCVDALDILTSTKDIQVVGADRSVAIGFGSHRFKMNSFARIDCSDLFPADFSKIFSSIPPAIRNDRMQIPVVEGQNSPSTFEFIEANVRGQSISDRYRDVLQQLVLKQSDLHDLFVMICYVFSCHAPVSFDVVSRFMGLGGDYKAVYHSIEQLGKLLGELDTSDSEFIDLDDKQDHFVPRSLLISETVVEMCKNGDFRRVYLRFHSGVPRLFIPRFSTFRRYGYRSVFVERVFPNWEDGEEFYLRAYRDDRTYFLKQQLAIYLGIRKQFELAFKYIDEALTESKNKNPNVRHTHARLLFDANIEKAVDNPSLRGNLRKSMEILEGCYEYDKRQPNHATRFAEQSLRYATVFPGADADAYLKKATGWLAEEIKSQPSYRYANILYAKLRSQSI